MDSVSDIRDEFDELAGMGMELARTYAAAVKEAMELGDWHHGMKLGQAFHAAARDVRLTRAIQARLVREAARGAEEDRQAGEAARKDAVSRRRDTLQAIVERLVEREADPGEASALSARLPHVLHRERDLPDFLEAPLETLVQRLRTRLGLKGSCLAGGSVVEGDGGGVRPEATEVFGPNAPGSLPRSPAGSLRDPASPSLREPTPEGAGCDGSSDGEATGAPHLGGSTHAHDTS